MALKDPEARKAYHTAYMAKRLAEDPEFKAKHLAAVRKNARAKRVAAREWMNCYLLEHPCVDCGEADPVVLEFDHVRGTKLGDVSNMSLRLAAGHPKLLEEIEKCEVRCANCHRRVTHARRQENRSE